ncbi:hypothetical protein E1B28_008753 [Marasmius oreades]|uniref:Uncharacterized protein n=1 Tax=Marasmius oreades TaxID=181124 RepID=A0A9P7RZ14_9AGAR|nr:uncharacterized protein E1B28_008753 [Marasmius oreades]KAG7092396.1 hypothetical protein E1B28_008753 [Marasmius oreades]
MHRFRKKSDAKTTLPPLQVGLHLQTQYLDPDDSSDHQDLLPELPSADDFRTSLILPDLSQRFSLLRDSSGDPLSVDVLKSRLADQRARGAENQISEEEEEMILETLGLRPKTPQSGDGSQENLTDGVGSMRQSVRSTATANSLATSVTSSPSFRSKRYSNNLFGSGRLRDYSYTRLTSAARSSNKNSILSTDSEIVKDHSLNDDSQPDPAPAAITTDVVADQPLPASDSQETKLTSSSVYKRASLALAQAIRELEEDVEDEVVMPRSIPLSRSSLDQSKESGPSRTPQHHEAGMAISSDTAATPEAEVTKASPILSRVSPGYVPGMPRPMTPHEDNEHDILRSHSTTPRATPSSASSPDLSHTTSPSLISDILNHGPIPTSTRQSSGRPTSPLSSSAFLHRKTSIQNERSVGDPNFFSGSTHNWSRPSSPLAGTSLHFNSVSQRPSTPSNVTWTFPSNKISPQNVVHTRSGSWFSDAGLDSVDTHESYENPQVSATRSLRSPALPDSPLITATHSTMLSFSSKHSGNSEYRPWSPMSGLDGNAPNSYISRAVRSPTPTQTSPARSPTSPTFPSFDIGSKNGSRRSSKQNSSSHFSLSAFNPVVFSPIANSSRSSLESVGSSFHSGDGDRNDRLAAFVDIESPEPAWHDISFPTHSHSTTPGGSPDAEWNAEDVINRTGGINKSDISAIQEKLVGFAFAKTTPITEVRERAPSLRRRRPSTSQSNYSFNGRIASPPPQLQGPTSNSPDQLSPKASALLKSVVDSIQAPQNESIIQTSIGTPEGEEDGGDISPSTRRNRDLAQILFGNENADIQEDTFTPPVTSVQVESPLIPYGNEIEGEKAGPFVSPPNSSVPETPSLSSSGSYAPIHPDRDADLAREVQRKAEAAMMALRKHYNSSKDGFGSTTSLPRKRIAPHQISTPTLVSASTSVDTIPLRPPPIAVGHQTSKFGSHFRKLRGTLKKNNNTPASEEVTPYPLDIQVTPPPAQTIQYDPRKLHPIGGVATSATELGRFNVPATPITSVPSPPASAGPGLKGFMARFRGKQRTVDAVPEHERPLRVPIRSEKHPTRPTPSSTPTMNEGFPGVHPSPHPIQSPKAESPHSSPPMLPPVVPTSTEESAALRQLFDAASNLGLDQQKLNDLLLVRSGSTSSKLTDWTMLTRNNSTANAEGKVSEQNSSERAVSPPGDVDNLDRPISRKPSIRQASEASHRLRERSVDPASVVVRRTIFFPSDNKGALPVNLNALTRKASARRRRASATSISSRSVHERVPTPPPRRASSSRRPSTDTPPPVPPISPLVASRPDVLLSVPNGPVDKGSAYDSFYEMYADENSKGSTSESNQRNTTFPDSGQGIEFIELANGETIWQIVNGLRDDDADSLYTGRTSFASDYDNDEGVQLFFKEHARSGSKGSASSFISRRKSVKGNGGNAVRPDTKVFFSSSAQIGRLIDNLSQGLDAGSFNILPSQTNAGYSATSSLSEGDMQFTMEERLERMLGRLERGET